MKLQDRSLILLQSLNAERIDQQLHSADTFRDAAEKLQRTECRVPYPLEGGFLRLSVGYSTRTKTTALATNVEFPLWIGRTWSYEGEAVRVGQSPTTITPRIPTRIDCHVTAFRQLSVAAGTFESFECECQCTHQSAHYEPGCGEWTIWYAPAVKQIIRTKTGSTAATAELIEYRASHPIPSPKVQSRESLTLDPQDLARSGIVGVSFCDTLATDGEPSLDKPLSVRLVLKQDRHSI
jgi:hypothetical protein